VIAMTGYGLAATVCLTVSMLGVAYVLISKRGSRLDRIGKAFAGVGAIGVKLFFLLDHPADLADVRGRVASIVIGGFLAVIGYIFLRRRGQTRHRNSEDPDSDDSD